MFITVLVDLESFNSHDSVFFFFFFKAGVKLKYSDLTEVLFGLFLNFQTSTGLHQNH